VAALLAEARRTTRKPLLVYPNSGERYDPVNKVWLREPGAENWDTLVPAWYRLGAVAIGGCCRVGPERIARIRRRLYQPSS
jgi:homocysteine S-methyltransferase